MWIAAGTLFFTLAVFLNSIELSSSQSFWELFPETLCDTLPPIKTLEYKETEPSWNLRKLVDNRITEFISNSTLIARANVIVGWRDKDNIEPLSDLSGETNHVFDTNQKLFIKLNRNDLKILGANRRLSKIRTLEQADPLRRPTPRKCPLEKPIKQVKQTRKKPRK
ncbi:uncharacterized protein LOC117182905 [Belonocnema kinseyi]|uniref:uncharacterized protein LOC117182905 n=1 Tax=Belonocnema kinseyi TaxID=2817044 RepID=UPI00143DC168|nr:uncharacterized protein LOC117182905 [Belonocnema kinseyi]